MMIGGQFSCEADFLFKCLLFLLVLNIPSVIYLLIVCRFIGVCVHFQCKFHQFTTTTTTKRCSIFKFIFYIKIQFNKFFILTNLYKFVHVKSRVWNHIFPQIHLQEKNASLLHLVLSLLFLNVAVLFFFLILILSSYLTVCGIIC